MMNEIAKNSNSNTYVIEMSTICYFEIIIILLVQRDTQALRSRSDIFIFEKSKTRSWICTSDLYNII